MVQPFFFGESIEVGIGIYGEGAPGDGEHGSVVNGIAESGVDLASDDFADCFSLAFAGGHANEAIGGEVVFDVNAGGDYVFLGNAEATGSLGDDPIISGRNCP